MATSVSNTDTRLLVLLVKNCSVWNRDGYEYEFIGRIVELVSSKINHAPLPVAGYPVGLESQVLEVKKLSDVWSDDCVHMIGIHGIVG